jgi:hypothetical protein
MQPSSRRLRLLDFLIKPMQVRTACLALLSSSSSSSAECCSLGSGCVSTRYFWPSWSRPPERPRRASSAGPIPRCTRHGQRPSTPCTHGTHGTHGTHLSAAAAGGAFQMAAQAKARLLTVVVG